MMKVSAGLRLERPRGPPLLPALSDAGMSIPPYLGGLPSPDVNLKTSLPMPFMARSLNPAWVTERPLSEVGRICLNSGKVFSGSQRSIAFWRLETSSSVPMRLRFCRGCRPRRPLAPPFAPALSLAGISLLTVKHREIDWRCSTSHVDGEPVVEFRVVHVVGCARSEEHTSELQSHSDLVCRLLL